MKKNKEYMIIVYTILALAINLLGRVMAAKLTLPIWCDSIGTFLIAYIAGPVCGGVVGFTNNIIYGIFVEQQVLYCILGALLGAMVGYFAQKKVFETQFDTMTFGMVLALFCTIVSVMINTVLYNGKCGNVWGSQVMLLCIDNGFPKYVAYILGQFCVEFLDKLLSVEIVFLLIKFVKHQKTSSKKILKNTGTLLIAFVIIGIFSKCELVLAKEISTDYDSYVQREYSNEEGLLSGEANDIAQTKDGKLWIGTYAGLFKYNGTRFKLFQDVSSVKNVNCLYVDEEGRLWVGSNDDGVTIFINEHVMNVIDEDSGLLSNTVKSIVCDSTGNYYIGTTEGVSLVTLNSGVKVIKSFNQIKNVIHMSSDPNGNTAVVTDRGELYWFQNGELTAPPLDVVSSTGYRAVLFTEDHKLLLGTTTDDVLVYDMTSNLPELIYTIHIEEIEGINSFYVSENNEMFICADTGIAVMQTDGTYHKINTNNFSNSIENMLIDYQGNLWFSSSRLGLLELCQSPFMELFPEIGENEVVNTTEKWQGLLFCGTDNGLVIVDETKKSKIDNELSKLFSSTRIRCLKADSKNNLWIATTEMGLYKISAKTHGKYSIRQFTEEDGMPGMRFRSVLELKDGRIVVAGDYGIAILFKDSIQQVFSAQSGLYNEKSLCLLEYKDVLYIGSDGGGITKIKDDHIVRNIGKKDGLSSQVILRMVYDPFSDGVFIITGNGLCYMSSKEEIVSLDNFPYSNNFDMICDSNGTCWIMSSAGIYVAETKALLANSKREYPLMNAKRGFRSSLTSNSWICRENDDLYLCCDDGVVKVNMSQYDMSAKSYRMILNSVEIDGVSHEINRADTFHLSTEMETLVFEPEILNYSMNDPYISVAMEGYDTMETVCLLSELDKFTYSKLKPGLMYFEFPYWMD